MINPFDGILVIETRVKRDRNAIKAKEMLIGETFSRGICKRRKRIRELPVALQSYDKPAQEKETSYNGLHPNS